MKDGFMYRTKISGSSSSFTLIELLIVIGIIAILAALLLPMLTSVRKKAIVVACVSNLKQCGIALNAYAASNDNRVFSGETALSTGPNAFLHKSSDATPDENAIYDFRPKIKSYIGDFSAWKCASWSGTYRNIDNSANIKQRSYGTFDYYPGENYPEFDGSGKQPVRFNEVQAPSTRPMLQDQIKYMDSGYYKSNHANQSSIQEKDNNPSGVCYATGGNGLKANVLFWDGHVKTFRLSEMDDVGIQNSGSTTRLYSVMP